MRVAMSVPGALLLALLICSSWASTVWAGETKKPVDPHCQDPLEVPLIPIGDPDDERIRLDADQTTLSRDSDGNQVVDLSGRVRAVTGQQAIETDEGHFTKRDQNFDATGGLVYQTPDLQILGTRGLFNLGTHLGHIESGEFRFFESTGHGTARQAELEPGSIIVLHQGIYTTCPKREMDWILRFSRLTLDRDEGIGVGRNVWLSFKGVPFLYTPFIRFPIDDRRRTGLLTPSYRYSSESGGELAIPFYLNLAPNYDLVLQPINMTGRGFMLGSDFRYLIPHGSGTFALDYLPKDEIRQKERHQIEWSHHSQLNPQLQTDIDIHRVSDEHFLEELGNSLSTSSLTYLPQRAAVLFSDSHWQGSVQIQTYQTVDSSIPETARPYQMMPQVTLASRSPLREGRPNFSITGQYTDFQRQERISGGRLRLKPRVSLPLRWTAARFDSALTWDHTQYWLDDLASDEQQPTRSLPTLSLDGRVFLERDFSWQGTGLRQTLEPRLFYLRRPYRDQSTLPIFDSGGIDLSYSQLFSENRFNGSDRLGDADQLTIAAASAIVDQKTGREFGRVQLGQIYYFQSRRVTLPGNSQETEPTSALTGDARIELTPNVSVKSDMRWDPKIDRFDKGNVSLQFHPGERQILNLSYRYRWKEIAQTDLSILWPLTSKLHLLGRWNRSTRDNRDLETLVGMEYDTCCWKFQLLRRRFVNSSINAVSTQTKTNKSWFFEMQFKGLTSLGNRIDTVLENGILGYRK